MPHSPKGERGGGAGRGLNERGALRSKVGGGDLKRDTEKGKGRLADVPHEGEEGGWVHSRAKLK
jgi:hypothetical protein